MIKIKRKLLTVVVLLCSAALLLSGCGGSGGSSDSDFNETADLNVNVIDGEDTGIPLVNVEVTDETQTVSKVTNDSGLVSFKDLDLSENTKYTVTAQDYSEEVSEFIAGDDFVTVTYSEADLVLFDDFADPDSGWPIIINEDPVRCEYVDGKYEVEINALREVQKLDWPNTYDGITDFAVSADLELARGHSAYGFSIDWTDNHIFIGILNTENSDIIWVNENGNYLLEKDISSYLSSGSSNRLMVLQEGAATKIFIDGDLVGEVSLSQVIPVEANIKVSINSQSSGDYPTVIMDNFRLISLN